MLIVGLPAWDSGETCAALPLAEHADLDRQPPVEKLLRPLHGDHRRGRADEFAGIFSTFGIPAESSLRSTPAAGSLPHGRRPEIHPKINPDDTAVVCPALGGHPGELAPARRPALVLGQFLAACCFSRFLTGAGFQAVAARSMAGADRAGDATAESAMTRPPYLALRNL